MGIDPTIIVAAILGGLASAWAIRVHMLSRSMAVGGGHDDARTKTFCLLSAGASVACLLLFSLVPDWRLIWIRWNRHDFCSLPGHSALRGSFILAASFAFLSPTFAYLAFRLAQRIMIKVLLLCLLLLSVFIVVLVVQGLFWPTDWK
jgi:hypothetical protein